MANVQITVRQCDLCGRTDQDLEITHFTVRAEDGKKVEADLCPEDAAPLLELLEALPQARRDRRKYPGLRALVQSVDEIPTRSPRSPRKGP